MIYKHQRLIADLKETARDAFARPVRIVNTLLYFGGACIIMLCGLPVFLWDMATGPTPLPDDSPCELPGATRVGDVPSVPGADSYEEAGRI